MTRAINFNAGPATLPLPALERAQSEMLDFAGTGMSVMEHSHRGKDYEAVHDETIALLRELYGVGKEHEVLFVQGGASQQFAQIPMNLLGPGESADYVVNGAWGEKAFAEAEVTAKLIGAKGVRVAASTGEGTGKTKSYRRVPRQDEMSFDPKASYVHLTTNETIHGIQFPELPDTGSVPRVVDMSSDFMWKRTDISKLDFVYAGAQKNLGPSGIVVVLVKKTLLERGRKDIPKIFQYRTVAENNSLYNTPPTFAIYLARNVLLWMKSIGGLARVEADNAKKAETLYRVMDAHPDLYACPIERTSRSSMNVVFRLPSEDLEARFLDGAKKERMVGLKGHRSVGGVRVSLYNAVSLAWVETLVDYMERFAAGL